VPPLPPPVPPAPTPGQRAVLMIWESGNPSTDVARLITGLRAGTQAAYLKQQGHTLSILDKDEKDESGQPSKTAQAWAPMFAGMALPAVFVIDPKSNTLIHKESIPQTATADSVIAIVKANGG